MKRVVIFHSERRAFGPKAVAAMSKIRDPGLPRLCPFTGASREHCKIVPKCSDLTSIFRKEMRALNPIGDVVFGDNECPVIDKAMFRAVDDHITFEDVRWNPTRGAGPEVKVNSV